MRVLGIIPARGGSKRVPRKNLRLLGGKPLIGWTIEAAGQSDCLTRLVVSSDDEEILSIARRYDSSLPLKRPADISTDTAPALAYVRHALAALEDEAGDAPPFDAVAILQPSSPLTLPQDIDATINLLDETGADTAVSVMQVDHAVHPLKLKIFDEDNGDGKRLLPFWEEERGRMAEHEMPKVFVRNCAVYATRRRVVEAGAIIGADCRGYVMPRERSIDINDEMDLLFAEFLLARMGEGASRVAQ